MLASFFIPHITKSLRGTILAGFLLMQTLAFANEGFFERIHFDEINSTQTYAKEHATEFLDSPGKWALVTADRQSNGHGTNGRKWESSSSGNLYVTYVMLFPKAKSEELFHVVQVAGFSVAQTLQDFDHDPQIKWVNDIFLDGKKVSGCLCEIIESPFDDYYYLLVGIGINVNMTQEEISRIGNPATSMYLQSLQQVDKEAVLNTLSSHLKESVDHLLSDGFSGFYGPINELLLFKGKLLQVELKSKEIVQGRLLGIDYDGALLLQSAEGELFRVLIGRIVHTS